MSRLVCCVRVRRADMGAALSLQEGEACEGGLAVAPPTMADVIRERKKKAGGAGLGTLRRRLAAAARRPKDSRPDRGCEHARFIRSVVSSWRVAEVFVLCEQMEAGAALRDLCTQAELAREPAQALHIDLAAALHTRWWCDVELVGAGWSIPAHRAILAARSSYFRNLMLRYPTSQWRVPLEGPGARLTREEMEACLVALYSGATPSLCTHSSSKWERGSQDQLDIINVDSTGTLRSLHGCSCYGEGGTARRHAHSEGGVRRLASALGFSPDSLHRDMRYLLDSGEYADSRLVFRLEGGCGVQYGFRTALELPVHRVILAARSRFFRSVMTRRTSNPSSSGANSNAHSGCVCVDEKVLPRRFARALLHAAYTDQVDLSLIGRASTPPSTNNNPPNASSSPWPGVARSAAGNTTNSGSTALDDAFQLYEIARFLEMPIVVQGCEDCIVEALSPETLPGVLRWACAPHASQWVHRQAMRYLRDEFPSIMSHAAAVRLPRTALAEALSSPFLQASEAQALRALMRWGVHHQPQQQQREPNVVWHTAHSVSRRVGGGGRRRDVSDAAVREALADLITLVRVEHLPPDNELLQQAIRRGLIDGPAVPEETGSAAAWLGRGSYRPARCFLPYLDELKALLEEQAAPEAEVARVRRARLTHRIPDTLYMVAAARNTTDSPSPPSGEAGAGPGAESLLCVSPRALAALRTRLRELSAAPPAATALKLHAANTPPVYKQPCARACASSAPRRPPPPRSSCTPPTHRPYTNRYSVHLPSGEAGAGAGAESLLCVSPRALAALRTRLRELSAAPPAATALKLHAANTPPVYKQCTPAERRGGGGGGGGVSAVRVPARARSPAHAPARAQRRAARRHRAQAARRQHTARIQTGIVYTCRAARRGRGRGRSLCCACPRARSQPCARACASSAPRRPPPPRSSCTPPTHRPYTNRYSVHLPSGEAGAGPGAESLLCVSPRALAALRTRLRELSAAPPAATALKLHAANTPPVYKQIALRAVREMSLPDACADLLLRETDTSAPDRDRDTSRERASERGQWEEPRVEEPWSDERQECSRTLSGSGSLRCASAGSLRSAPSLHIPIDTTTRAGTCRRELPSRPDSSHRSSLAECSTLAARLSAAVPDVAMAPNANTHLLTNRDYCRHPPPAEYGPVLQLDLGDGATHTPRPGSRAFRAAHSAERARREQQGHSSHSSHSSHSVAAIVPAGAARSRHGGGERGAALHLSVIRAYSGFVPVAGGSPLLHTRRSPAPHPHYRELPPYATVRNRTTPSPSLSGGSATHRVELPALTHRRDDGECFNHHHHHHHCIEIVRPPVRL
ncbi:hypothetical protein O0L34_g10639 [Tuta absoluta]|nr:hypothetical protein O0L34_g10639 [Tuta absoluta]